MTAPETQTWVLPGGTVCCPDHINGCPPGAPEGIEQQLKTAFEKELTAVPPVLDANGDPVPGGVPEGIDPDAYRQFYAGRVPAPECPHYLSQMEFRAGFTTCERC